MNITSEIAQKVLTTVDAGLVKGKGKPIPGQMCIEAAVCYALGLPHDDNPDTCVAQSLRQLKIVINDENWSSPQTRAKGMRKLALLQLGTVGVLDEIKFTKTTVMLVVNKYLPKALRVAGLEEHAVACEQAADLDAAYAATTTAYAAAETARAAAYAANAFATAATRTIDAATDAAADAVATVRAAAVRATDADAATTAAYAAAETARAAATAHAARAAAATYAARAARAAADAAYATAADAILTEFCEDVAQILIQMQVPGVQWLNLL